VNGADADRFVVGTARHVADFDAPDAAWMSVVRSDLPHGTIVGIDSTAAREAPGVIAVFTAGDVGQVPRIPIRVGATASLETHGANVRLTLVSGDGYLLESVHAGKLLAYIDGSSSSQGSHDH